MPDFPRVVRPKTERETQEFIERRIIEQHERWSRTWVLDFQDDRRAIGYVTLASMTKVLSKTPHSHGGDLGAFPSIEISCALSPEFQKQGLMREARIPVIAWAFESLPLVMRIHSEIAENNLPSLKMNQKLEFEDEGLLKNLEGPANHIRILGLGRETYSKSEVYREWREFIAKKLS